MHTSTPPNVCVVYLRATTRKATFERSVVVLFLASHAVEIFLKSAILRKASEERFSHDLEYLKNRYEALYPAKRFKFHIPFHTSYDNLTADQMRQAKLLTPKKDQLFRYPRDKNGEPWHGVHAFEAGSFLLELVTLRSSFKRLLREY